MLSGFFSIVYEGSAVKTYDFNNNYTILKKLIKYI